MPILWWFLLRNYFKVLFLSVISFIAILLVSRLEEIAQFAALGAKPFYLVLFVLYQIPYVLPFAIPISCLISSILLFQRLSYTSELVALRAGGITLSKMIAPIFYAAILLACATFYITSELATSSHLAARRMTYNLSSVNPLLLLQSSKIARLKNAFIQMDPIRNGEAARNLVIALNRVTGNRLCLCLIDQVEMKEDQFVAKQINLISSAPCEGRQDHLIIENQQWLFSSAEQLAALMHQSHWKFANDYLKLSLLRIRLHELRQSLISGENVARSYKKCQTEIVRRFSLSFATVTFTLMGMALGMEIGRRRSKKRLLLALFLAAFTLIAFCAGKAAGHLFYLATIYFLLPHLLIIATSLWTLYQIKRGIE
jgi:lipopolysaccharide export system permease protein